MRKNMLMVAAVVGGAMGFAGAASANVATQVFSWTGSVPAAPSHTGWIIKTPQQGDIASGILVFNADANGKGVLTGATDLAFNVFDYSTPPTVGAVATNYTYQLSSLRVNSSGLAQEQGADGYFEILADGAAMTKGTNVLKTAGGDTTLTVAPTAVATPSNQPSAGDDVSIQATIVVVSAT
jgi:hypothetical protein